MKRATLALLVMAGIFFARADPTILVNSDFSGGRAHWKGDAQALAKERSSTFYQVALSPDDPKLQPQ